MRKGLLFYTLLLPLVYIARFSPFGHSLFRWSLWLLLIYTVLPLLLARAFGFSKEDVGLSMPRGDVLGPLLLLLLLAFLLSIAGTRVPSMVSYYPRFSFSGVPGFIAGELVMGLIMLTHELFFRGFMMFPLVKWNWKAAVLLQDIPYALAHLGKPGLEVPYSFLAGIVFGWLDVRGRSFIPSFVLHWTGSVVFDVLCVLVKTGVLSV